MELLGDRVSEGPLTSRDEGHTYDVIGQWTDVSIDVIPAYHYEYDQNGNRTVADDLLARDLATPTYDAQGRLCCRDVRSMSGTTIGTLESGCTTMEIPGPTS